MIIFGGYDNEGFINNDIWSFNFENLEWEEIKPTNKISERYHHSSIILNSKMFIFGGLSSNNNVLNDLIYFDFGK